MPARMHVEFVQEMAPAPPPGRPAPPPAAPPKPAPRAAVPVVAQAASEPAPSPEVMPPVVPELPAPAVAEAAPAQIAASAPREGAPATASPADGEPGPEWPLSTRLTYVLTGNYRGPVSGQAQVEWLRKGSDYQVHLDVGIGPSFAPIATRRMSSQGLLTPEGISPRSYDEETRRIFGEPQRFNLVFLGGVGGPQDSVSQFVQLTWLFLTGREPLQPGHIVKLPLRLPSGPYDWQYEVMGEELLNTDMGPLAAWRLKPRQAARGGDLTAEVWLAPTLQYLPVRLLIRQDTDIYIDLTLKSAPLQAAPESTNGIPRRLSQ